MAVYSGIDGAVCSDIIANKVGDASVTEFAHIVGIKKDVTRFEVTMDHGIGFT